MFFLFADNIPAYLKKNDDSMPCAALLQIRNIVAFECPSRMLKLLGPVKCTGQLISYRTIKVLNHVRKYVGNSFNRILIS